MEVEVDDSLLETLKAHHVPLAHDVAGEARHIASLLILLYLSLNWFVF